MAAWPSALDEVAPNCALMVGGEINQCLGAAQGWLLGEFPLRPQASG